MPTGWRNPSQNGRTRRAGHSRASRRRAADRTAPQSLPAVSKRNSASSNAPTPPPAAPEAASTAAEAWRDGFSSPTLETRARLGSRSERFGHWSRTMRVPQRVPLILTSFIAIASSADAECLSSAESVLAAHHGSHAVWTRRLPGHIGDKCWFASSAETKVIHADDDARQIRPLSAEGAPLPRPRSQDTATATEHAPVTGADDSRDASREIEPVSVMASPPLPPSQETLSATERAPPAAAKSDSTGGARSILIWGRPMGLDAAWEEIFTRRARAAE
jgi:hypothetical protein